METYFEFASIVKIFNFMFIFQKKINLHSHEDPQFEGVIDYLSFLRKPSLLRFLDIEVPHFKGVCTVHDRFSECSRKCG